MAPKKGEVVTKRVILGRATNNVSMGIVGLPNVGKSSFFNVLTKLSVPASNFPFCTIDPNTAKVPVPDLAFKELCEKFKPKSVVPAVLTVTDIAGLVRGASDGLGLGNAFLSHIRAVDGIFHLCRGFDNPDVTHVEESVDPVRDLEIIHVELQKKDLETAKKYVSANEKLVSKGVGGKEALAEFNTMKKCVELLESGKDIRSYGWSTAEIEMVNTHFFLTAKPMIYLVNLAKKNFLSKSSKWLPKIDAYVKDRGLDDMIIPFSVDFEEELLAAEDKKAFLAECGEGVRSMLPKIIHKGYECLDLIHYFTAGADECKCWTIRRGTLAPKAAGIIHSDFEKGFICAEIYTMEDFKQYNGDEVAIKAAGKVKQQGKTYEVQDKDVILFKFN